MLSKLWVKIVIGVAAVAVTASAAVGVVVMVSNDKEQNNDLNAITLQPNVQDKADDEKTNYKNDSYNVSAGVLSVNGNEVRLPCTVQEFLDGTGLCLQEDNETIEAHNYKTLYPEAKNGEYYLHLNAVNYTDEEISVLEGMVTGFECDSHRVILDNGVKIGMSLQEVKTLFKNPDKESNYEVAHGESPFKTQLSYCFMKNEETGIELILYFDENNTLVNFGLGPN